MLKKLHIKNFKCLRDTGELEIRPLTFLVGPNSSGKSSVLQILLLLRQTVDSTGLRTPLATSNGWIQMGAYPEFIFKNQTQRNLEIDLEISNLFIPIRIPTESKKKYMIRKVGKLFLRVAFYYNRKTGQILLKEREIKAGKYLSEKVIWCPQKREYSAILSILGEKKRHELIRENVNPIKFYDFEFSFRPTETTEEFAQTFPFYPMFTGLGYTVEKELRNFFYLGPLREFPKRTYVTSGQSPQDVGTKGEHAIDVLWFSHMSESKRIRRIEDETRYWIKKFDIASDIRLERISKGNYRLAIIDMATGAETNLADIGFGASQTLPIIIESFYAPPRSMILIEQPEIHLHPKAQSLLGDLFIKAASEANRSFIIETHSEHILARIRRRIAEGQINKDNVAIYYFDPSPKGTNIHEITLNKDGQYESFPKGFFEEDVLEAFEHLKAIQSRKDK